MFNGTWGVLSGEFFCVVHFVGSSNVFMVIHDLES